MEPTTSFIPKKAIVEERRGGGESAVSLVTAFIVIAFLVTILTAIGMLLYKVSLERKLASTQDQLKLYQDKFNPEQILEMKRIDERITTASEILAAHQSPSQFMKFLQSITFKNVRFTDIAYAGADQKEIKVKLNGQATNYEYVGYQSDALKANKYVKEYLFSGFELQADGKVAFSLEMVVDPTFIKYENALKASAATAVNQ